MNRHLDAAPPADLAVDANVVVATGDGLKELNVRTTQTRHTQ